jgi:D-3-phosphoglycerate dehydrogenase
MVVARRSGESERDLGRRTMRPQEAYQGVELSGKVMGIIGVGGAGLRLARMTKHGLGMWVIGYDPHREPWPDGVERFRTLESLLAEADFLSMHVPLTPETRNLIGARALARMKPAAILVNTARGGVVDEAALAEAIRAGRLGGAGLDVLVDEPLRADHPLAGLPNVVLTPHTAGVTEEAMVRMATHAAEEVLRVLRGERPMFAVNPEVLRSRKG